MFDDQPQGPGDGDGGGDDPCDVFEFAMEVMPEVFRMNCEMNNKCPSCTTKTFAVASMVALAMSDPEEYLALMEKIMMEVERSVEQRD